MLFFDAIIKDQGMLPSKILFIDNIAENVNAVKKCRNANNKV